MRLETKGKVYYLASPYSHEDKDVMHDRAVAVDKLAQELILMGYNLFEPITMCHQKHLRDAPLPTGYEYWKERDREFVSRSDGVIVSMIDGWDTSIGVADEVSFAKSLGLPVYYINPINLEMIEEIPNAKTRSK